MDHQELVMNVFVLVGAIITAMFAGGALSLGGLVVAVKHLKSDEAGKLAVEKLFLSTPIVTQASIRNDVGIAKQVVEIGQDVVDLADEVTDGKLPAQN